MGTDVGVTVFLHVVVHLLHHVERRVFQSVVGIVESLFARINVGLHAGERPIVAIHALVGHEGVDLIIRRVGMTGRTVVYHVDAKRQVPPLGHLQVAVVGEGE